MTHGKGGSTSAVAIARERIAKFENRKVGLKRKAEQLVSRCAVDVAVVCTGPGGEGGVDCWPSREEANAVVRRYNAVNQAQRARHAEDHADHFARRLAEEREKLARAREGGLAGALGSWDGSLEGVPEGKLRQLLTSIEASLVAARNRVLKLRQPLGGAADRATSLPGPVHEDEATKEDSVPATIKGVPPRGEAGAGGGGPGLPPSINPSSPNAVPMDADVEVVTGEGAGDELQILEPPPGDAAAGDAERMRGLVDHLQKRPQPYSPAAYAAGIEYINLGGFVMERDAYDFIRFDLGMPPPPYIAPNSPDDDGEPLKLWSWDNTMPPPPKQARASGPGRAG